jgi:hypothetical protein
LFESLRSTCPEYSSDGEVKFPLIDTVRNEIYEPKDKTNQESTEITLKLISVLRAMWCAR